MSAPGRTIPSNQTATRTFGGVLAAGHGARFQAAGVRTPKALVEVGGRSLIRRTLDAFGEAGFACVTVVVNDAVAPLVAEHLAREAGRGPAVDTRVKTTASTLETFATLLGLASASGADRFVLTTVDAVSAAGELARFTTEAVRAREPLVLGVASVEPGDDSPLRATLGDDGRLRLGEGSYATAGFYAGDTASIAGAASDALAQGLPSLRAFLTRYLLVVGCAWDRPGANGRRGHARDVAAAERALRSWGPGGVE